MNSGRQVLVCQYTNCLRNGSAAVLASFQAWATPGTMVIGCGCQGQCNMGATVRVLPDDTWYCRVKAQDVQTIVEEHLKQGRPVSSLLHPRFHPAGEEAV
ncbi:MAG: (2Fe-2S) ferredoxin domain-containing protein [Stenomitos rutilans HA7619-LM2]|nr:(2Fe-2S) ferredoxin domain-containing protein [Stenomitos rutilans HA7619-LM2]